MTGRIPSRKERRRRADEDSEKLNDQFDKTSDLYEDVREVVDTEDPSIEDYQLPEAIERMAAETIEIAEQRKAFSAEVEAFDEESKRNEAEMESMTMELQDTQLTNEELEQSTIDRLAWIKGFFEVDSKLAALVFEDKALFEDAIRDIRVQGNRLQTKMHHVLEDMHSLRESIHSAKEEYDERLNNLVEPLRQELNDTKQQLEDSKALGSSTDEELAKVNEELKSSKQEHQTTEKALQDEIEEHKAEIERLKNEAETSLRQNTHFQTEMKRLESEKDALSAQNAQQETTIETLRESHSQQTVQHDAEVKAMTAEKKTLSDRNDKQKTTIEALRESRSQQTVRHDAEVKAMIAEKKILSDRNDKQEAEIEMLQVTFKDMEEELSRHNVQLQAHVRDIQVDKNTLDVQVIQAETLNRALHAEKDALSTRINRQEARIHTLDVERDDLTGQISQLKARIHDLEVEKGDLIDRNGEYEQRIQTLNKDHKEKIDLSEAAKGSLADEIYELQQEQARLVDDLDDRNDEVHQLENDRDAFKDQVQNLQRDMSDLSIQHEQKQTQIKDLEANVKQLVKKCDDQSNQTRQHRDEISQLKSDLESRQNALQGTINHADEERASSQQTIQQLQHFLFSKLPSIQNDQTISIPAASGNRLLFKGQQLSISQDTLAQWIQGPLKETLDTLTNSTDTLNLAETYQLVLGSLTCLQSSNIQDKESLLECMRNFQTWLTKACKDRTSILGLALAHAIKVIQEGPQSDPWFSTSQFDASRTIDSRNSELPQTTSIIADGCPGIVLVVQGTSIQVCEATDIFMRQQTSFGIQLIFNEALNSPDLQLLADSWPHMDRWEPLIVWAVNVGRFNLVKKGGQA